MSPHGKKKMRGLSGAPFIRAPTPSGGLYPYELIIFPKPQLPIPSHRRLGFQHTDLRDARIQAIASLPRTGQCQHTKNSAPRLKCQRLSRTIPAPTLPVGSVSCWLQLHCSSASAESCFRLPAGCHSQLLSPVYFLYTTCVGESAS